MLMCIYLLLLMRLFRRHRRRFKFNHLDFICWNQVNLLSRVRPRYLIHKALGILVPYTKTYGQGRSLRVFLVWVDFD